MGIEGDKEVRQFVSSTLQDISLQTWAGPPFTPPSTLLSEHDPTTIKKTEPEARKQRLAALCPPQPHWEAVAVRRLCTYTMVDPPRLALFKRLDEDKLEKLTCACGALKPAKYRMWHCAKSRQART